MFLFDRLPLLLVLLLVLLPLLYCIFEDVFTVDGKDACNFVIVVCGVVCRLIVIILLEFETGIDALTDFVNALLETLVFESFDFVLLIVIFIPSELGLIMYSELFFVSKFLLKFGELIVLDDSVFKLRLVKFDFVVWIGSGISVFWTNFNLSITSESVFLRFFCA